MPSEITMEGFSFDGELYVREADCRKAVSAGMEKARLAACARDDAHIEMYRALEALQKQALQSTVNDPTNEWGMEALEMTDAALRKARGETT